MSSVRTRFAPSPTGFLHVGGIRTALFAYLVARHDDGKFVLRFEDTDKKREVEGAKEHLILSLNTLGLKHDEGPDIGGPFSPYIQSQRLEIYHKWARKLIAAGRAYADSYSVKELETLRQQDQQNKKPFLFRNHRPLKTIEWDGTVPLRFKSEPKAYEWHDVVMGDLRSSPESIDDFILIKSDGYPTYNFAHIIDDLEMEITHVLRGQEFLSSIPNYLNLYEALGISRPLLATLPLVLGPDGKKKLSKRDGAKDIMDYIRDGYLPEALVSFIATLGWNDGTTQEIFTMEELIAKFDLNKVQKSGALFDEKRLTWINGTLIRSKTIDDLYELAASYWPEEAADAEASYKRLVLSLLQERLKYLAEIPELSLFFFVEPQIMPELIKNNKHLKKLSRDELINLLTVSLASLNVSDFSIDDLNSRLNQLLVSTNQKPAVLFSLIRIATTQAPASPGLSDTLHVLGKERSLLRIKRQLDSL